jgi:hypothetical protein
MLIASTTSNSDFQKAPAGNHLARLYRIVDLGTQSVDWKGKINMLHKVQFFFELHGEDMDGKPLQTDDKKPLIQTKRYTISLNEKSTMRKDLESWRGKPFTDEELVGFDLTKLLGAWGMVTISHNTRDGKTYANLDAITPVPSMIVKAGFPEGVNELFSFSLNDFDEKKFESLSEGLKETIKKSAEYRGTKGSPTLDAANAELAKASLSDIDDDMPF